jgi:hypothetical protein
LAVSVFFQLTSYLDSKSTTILINCHLAEPRVNV